MVLKKKKHKTPNPASLLAVLSSAFVASSSSVCGTDLGFMVEGLRAFIGLRVYIEARITLEFSEGFSELSALFLYIAFEVVVLVFCLWGFNMTA